MKTLFRPCLALTALFAAPFVLAAERAVFEDDFSNSGSGWPDTQIADHNAKGISLYNGDGGYQMTPVDDATFGIVPAPKQADVPDVALEAGLFLYTGVGQGTGGLVCRHRDNDHFYAFMISGNHGYAILKVEGGVGKTLVSGRFDAALPNMADVRIGARCEGDTLTMTIDGAKVAEAKDATYADGRVGLIVVGEKTAGTSAVFDDFALSAITR